jgi:hypothetical protein
MVRQEALPQKVGAQASSQGLARCAYSNQQQEYPHRPAPPGLLEGMLESMLLNCPIEAPVPLTTSIEGLLLASKVWVGSWKALCMM